MNRMIVSTALGALMMMPLLAKAQSILSDSDKNFVTMAAEGGMTEVQTSKIAKKMSSSKDVDAFAQHMIDDHSKANRELKTLARTLNVTVPKELDAEHKAEVTQLKTASQSDFDQKYIAIQDKEHNDALTTFQNEADNGDNAQLKAFAARTLPTLQEHMSEVKKLEAAMPPAATTGTTDTTQ